MVRFYKPQKQAASTKKLPLKQLVVERLSDDGRGIAKLPLEKNKRGNQRQGKTVFIDSALPGEIVDAELLNENSRYIDACVQKITVASEQRVVPVCQHYSECGGCQLQHMGSQQQQQFKLQVVLDQLNNWENLSPEEISPTISSDQYHYRRRVRLGVGSKKSRILGFRRKHSQQLVAIRHCPIMRPSLERLIEPLGAWLNVHKPILLHVEMIDVDTGPCVSLTAGQKLSSQAIDALLEALPGVQCWLKQGKAGAELISSNMAGALSYGLTAPADNKTLNLSFHPQDFIQGHGVVNQQMVNQAIAWLEPESHQHIIDLFCGIGNFSLPLSRLVKRVTGIEGVAAMVDRARSNAEVNDCHNAGFFRADLFNLAEWIDNIAIQQGCDSLLLDPPRAGAKDICSNIGKLNPKRIVYVSCDSATFTRDAQILNRNGYLLSRLGLVDMFPQTSHSELMALFCLTGK